MPEFTHIEMRYPVGHVERYLIDDLEDRERKMLEAITEWWFRAEELYLELDDRPKEATIVLEDRKAQN